MAMLSISRITLLEPEWRKKMIEELRFVKLIETKRYRLEHSLDRKNPNRFVDLDMVAYFFYNQVRAQEYTVRHQLADRFRGGQKMLGSGHSSFHSIKSQKISEEAIACLLFSFYMDFLKRQKYKYLSGVMGYVFGAGIDWQTPFYVKDGQGYKYNRDNDEDGCLRLECSSLSQGFLSLLWAFGFDKEQLYTSCISHDNIVISKPFDAVNRGDLAGINGADIRAIDGVEFVCSPEYEFIDTLPGIRRLVQDIKDGEPNEEQAKQFRDIVNDNLSNSFYMDPGHRIRMLRRDIFTNHYCTKVVGKTPFRLPYFDPLMALRYKNGLTDLFEEYKLKNTIFSGTTLNGEKIDIKQYKHDAHVKVSGRRIYSIPEVMDIDFKDSQFEYCGLKNVKFAYTSPDKEIVDVDKTMYEIARLKKRNLYLVLDEHDWRDLDQDTGLPQRILDMVNYLTKTYTMQTLPKENDLDIQTPVIQRKVSLMSIGHKKKEK